MAIHIKEIRIINKVSSLSVEAGDRNIDKKIHTNVRIDTKFIQFGD